MKPLPKRRSSRARAVTKASLFEDHEQLRRQLTEALEQRAALSEILRVISQSPADIQPVFDTSRA